MKIFPFNVFKNLKRKISNKIEKKLISKHPHKTEFTTKFTIHESGPNLKTFRIMDEEGVFLESGYKLQLKHDELLQMYNSMILGNMFDMFYYDLQRQGRISFYMTNFGEEAAQVGACQALKMEDLLYCQYRELGVFIHRKVPIQELADCNYSNKDDPNVGKQMPIHYGSTEKNIVTISSTLATQMPQAAGAAYAYKREQQGSLVGCWFGEGAASEGDAHAGFSFSASFNTPLLWLCRNNGYAISTPIENQYKGDGIAGRGLAYDMGTIRVDGNDILAVYDSVKAAREYAIKYSKPVMIELMTYRGSHHSTSDDATRYRDPEEIIYWNKIDNPILRTKKLLTRLGILSAEKEKIIEEKARAAVIESFKIAEQKLKPKITKMFEDVYHDMPWNIKEQKKDLIDHLKKYKNEYQIEQFSGI